MTHNLGGLRSASGALKVTSVTVPLVTAIMAKDDLSAGKGIQVLTVEKGRHVAPAAFVMGLGASALVSSDGSEAQADSEAGGSKGAESQSGGWRLGGTGSVKEATLRPAPRVGRSLGRIYKDPKVVYHGCVAIRTASNGQAANGAFGISTGRAEGPSEDGEKARRARAG